MSETEIGGDGRGFRSTLWTVVLRAKDEAAPGRRDALEALIAAYWKPVYFFVRRKGRDPETAKDLAQGFFTALLEKNYLQYVRRERGKFRTFLMTALDHYLADERDRERALKRGGGASRLSLDFAVAERQLTAEPTSPESPDAGFRKDWALRVLAQALQDLKQAYEADGKAEEFEILRLHLTAGAVGALPYPEIGRRLRLGEGEVRKRVHAARGRYREAIKAVVRAYTDTEEDAREEMRDLFSAFA